MTLVTSNISADPGDPSYDRHLVFGGMTDDTITQEYMSVGAAVGATMGTSYRTLTAAAQSLRIYDYLGGHNTDPTDHALGRTGAGMDVKRIYHGGQGDLSGELFYGEVYSARSGATHFLANPAVIKENGGLAAAGAATGAYLNHSEFIYNDNGLAVAVVDRVRNYLRTNGGNALSQVWLHDRPQSGGSLPIDAFYAPAGPARRGFDATPADFGTEKAAIVLKAGDRQYYNAVSAPDPLGCKWCATSLGSTYRYYDAGANAVIDVVGGVGAQQIGPAQITSTVPTVMKVQPGMTLHVNDYMAFEKVSNTQVRLKMRGSDGITRAVSLTLS
jgi:hypothetical protein